MNSELVRELTALIDRDTRTRDRLRDTGKLFNAYDDAMRTVHQENARKLDAIVQEHGWPGIPLVGLEGCRMAWRIAQHANCTPDLQRKFLGLMRRAVDKGEVPARQAAFLADRILFNEGKPQIYGTVLDWNDHGELSCELAEPAEVDKRRQAIGLPPYQDDLRRHRDELNAEGGHPPPDIAAYKRGQREWAETVGWRSGSATGP